MHGAPLAIAQIVRAHPDEQIYAAAFHLFYSDYSQILTPALAANAESAVTLHTEKSGTSWSTRWVPPDWKWDVLDAASDAMKPLYSKLTEEMHGASHLEWDTVLDAHDDLMASIARAITSLARNRKGEFRDLTLANNFVVAILEGQRGPSEYNRLVRASVAPSVLLELEGILLEEA